MKVYLAAGSKDADRVRMTAARLDALGLVITSRWWEPGAYGTPEYWAGKDACISRDLQRHIARSHIRAINEAQLVWVLWPDDGLRSTCEAELGHAIARQGADCVVIVTGARAHECTWTALADYRDADDLCGLAEVARLAIASRRLRLGASL